METLGLVLLKSAAWLTGFTLVYLLVLRNERYFRLNRIYLLLGIVASLLFPFYSFHYQVIVPSIASGISSVGELSAGAIVPDEPTPAPLFFWIYLIGITAFLLRLLFQTWKIVRKLRISGYEKSGSVKLVRTAEYVSSFSFFSFVFVNPSIANIEMEEIMNHEREHIQQYHWFDLLLVELTCIVQWFNPFSWIYAHLIRQNHEFLADESALERSSDPAVYQAALLNQLLGVPVFSLTNSFSYSLNKKRFTMMKKQIDSPLRKLKLLVVLPLMALLFYAFAVPDYKYGNDPNPVPSVEGPITVKGQVVKSDGQPLYGTSVILKGSTTGTITDKDGNFELKGIPSDGELFFSFVGFQGQSRKVSSEPMKITMEISKVGLDKITVVAYGTPPPPPPPPPLLSSIVKNMDDANAPLVFFDGKPIDKAELAKIDPSSIHHMSVLKGNDAVAVYGDRGKNGVILITSKAKSASDKAGAKSNLVAKQAGEEDVFLVVEEMPQFPGGEMALRKVISEAVKYPIAAIEKGIQGKVFITFVVSTTGKVEKAKVARGVDPLLDAEALRVVSGLSGWIPGKQRGQAVNVQYTVPVAFALSEKKENAAAENKTPQNSGKEVFIVVEQMPEFPGGSQALREALARSVSYPVAAQEKKIQGKVFVNFVVNAEGKVENATIARGVHPALDAEAIRVVSSLPDWKPGKQRGQGVSVAFTVPIEFVLQ